MLTSTAIYDASRDPPPTPTLEDLIADLAGAMPVYRAIARYPAALIAEALAAGLASEWEDSPDGPAILLSSLACERLGLVLSDPGAIDRARWVPAGYERSARPAPSASVQWPEDLDVGDGTLDPLKVLIGREEALAALAGSAAAPEQPLGVAADLMSGSPDRQPRPPMILIGSTRTDWRPSLEPERTRNEEPGPPCPLCGNRPLTPLEGCLGCLKTGVDHLLPPVHSRERPKPKPTPSGMGALAGGLGRRSPS